MILVLNGRIAFATFHATTTPVYRIDSTEIYDSEVYANALVAKNDGEYVRYSVHLSHGETEWAYKETANCESGDIILAYTDVQWTNTDIYNEDGTLYLAASIPVPVNPPNPTAMMMGYMVGQAIRK